MKIPLTAHSSSKVHHSVPTKANTTSGGRAAAHSVNPAMSANKTVTAGKVSAIGPSPEVSASCAPVFWEAARSLASIPTSFWITLSTRSVAWERVCASAGAAWWSDGPPPPPSAERAWLIMRAFTDLGNTSSTMREVAVTRRSSSMLRLVTSQSSNANMPRQTSTTTSTAMQRSRGPVVW